MSSLPRQSLLQQEPFASCADGNPGHVCQNGGRCIASDETDQYYCDCTSATKQSTSSTSSSSSLATISTVHFVGQWCHLAPEVYCFDDGRQENINATTYGSGPTSVASTIINFCVNGGQCATSTKEEVTTTSGTTGSDVFVPDGSTNQTTVPGRCQCRNNFVGIHCEFQPHEVVAPEQLRQHQVGSNIHENNFGESSDDYQAVSDDSADNEARTDDTRVPCGPVEDQNFCHHGTECIRTLEGQYACDCAAATVSAISSSGDIVYHHKLFAGRWCEYEATMVCDDTLTVSANDDSSAVFVSQRRPHFCANQGKCISASNSNDGNVRCECDESKWTGPSCEFPVSVEEGSSNATPGHSENNEYDGTENGQCWTQCLNGGECRKGSNVQGRAAASSSPSSPSSSTSSLPSFIGDFEYCVCGKGFTGPHCEHTYVECDNGEHYCLHGTTCVPPSNSSEGLINNGWTCDCQEPFQGDRKDSGEFCQHRHTTMCTTKDSETSVFDPRSSMTFCRNDGTCKEFVENGEVKVGCDCPPGYTGRHCELYEAKNIVQPSSPDVAYDIDAEQPATILFLSFVIGVISVIALIFLSLRWKGRKSQKERRERVIIEEVQASIGHHLHKKKNLGHSSFIEEEQGDFDPDFDERYLEEIELL